MVCWAQRVEFVARLLTESGPNSIQVADLTSQRITYLPSLWPRPIWSPPRQAVRLVSISRFRPLGNVQNLPFCRFEMGCLSREPGLQIERCAHFITLNCSLQGVHQALFNTLRRSQRIFGRRKLYGDISARNRCHISCETHLPRSKTRSKRGVASGRIENAHDNNVSLSSSISASLALRVASTACCK